MIQQFNTGPATGSSADWISAAVVPGAKLLPTMTKGPELAPLIDRPPVLSRTVDCPFAGLSAAVDVLHQADVDSHFWRVVLWELQEVLQRRLACCCCCCSFLVLRA